MRLCICILRPRSTGAMDFVPSKVGTKFETLELTMTKVNQWITQQPPDVNICNVQSIDYKVQTSWCELLFISLLRECKFIQDVK